MKALIVEDIVDDRLLLKNNLEHRGCEVIESGDGQEGLKMAAKHKPDFIISDALMPKMDGYQFLRAVKQDESLKSIPFIFYSAVYTGYKEAELAVSLGAEAFIIKPKDPDEFWNELRVILDEIKEKKKKPIEAELISEDEEFLRKYSAIVAAKLEEKVRELEKTRNELLEAQARFQHLLYNSLAVIYSCETSYPYTVTSMSQNITSQLGYEVREFMEDPKFWAEHIHPEDTDRVFKALPHMLEQDIYTHEYRFLHKNGTYRWMRDMLKLVRDKDGNPVEIVGSWVDITERKQTEEALRESESRLAAAQSRAQLGSWEVGIAMQTEFWSDEMFRIFDRNPALGVPTFAEFMESIHPEDRERISRLVSQAITEHKSYNDEYRIIRPDGSVRWIESQGDPAYDNENKMIRLIGTAQDITERKQAEEEIKKLNAELEQRVSERTAQLEAANKELESFSYSVSHDLRAPLRHIVGFVDLLKDRATQSLDEQSLRYMDIIRDSTNRMGTLIDDLLSFSRMGRAEMMKTKVNPNELVKEAINTLEAETKARDIVWKVDKLPEVYGDPAMLRLVLVNLISNALKFTRTRPQAKIEIGCTDNEKETVLYVKDNGVGFDMQYANKLFGLFQRLHSADQFEGTGVGLANVRRIIQRHGGRTRAEGKVDEGAMFYFSLPKQSA